jgi:hypothetical protein
MEEQKTKRDEWFKKHILPLIKPVMTNQEVDNVVTKIARKKMENPELDLETSQLHAFFKKEDNRIKSVQRIEYRFEENRMSSSK